VVSVAAADNMGPRFEEGKGEMMVRRNVAETEKNVISISIFREKETQF